MYSNRVKVKEDFYLFFLSNYSEYEIVKPTKTHINTHTQSKSKTISVDGTQRFDYPDILQNNIVFVTFHYNRTYSNTSHHTYSCVCVVLFRSYARD